MKTPINWLENLANIINCVGESAHLRYECRYFLHLFVDILLIYLSAFLSIIYRHLSPFICRHFSHLFVDIFPIYLSAFFSFICRHFSHSSVYIFPIHVSAFYYFLYCCNIETSGDDLASCCSIFIKCVIGLLKEIIV